MPTYTFNVPQANQQIAATQGPILENFTYLQTSIGTEHNFDTTDPAKTYHLQASMPNRALDPAALPTGTNGMYYIKDGVPKYYDGTTVTKFDIWPDIQQGTFTLSSAGSNVTVGPAIPANINSGIVYVWFIQTNPPNPSSLFYVTSGQFVRNINQIRTYQYTVSGDSGAFVFSNNPSTNNAIRGAAGNATYANKVFNYRIYYNIV